MSRFKAPSAKDRHGGGGGTPVGVAARGPRQVPVPPLVEGKVRCRVCRNVVTPTATGRLRKHHDLFGNECPNRAGGRRVDLDEVPPVAIPPVGTPPTQAAGRPAAPVEPDSVLRAPITGACHDCGKAIPPGRRLCGRCFATGGRR